MTAADHRVEPQRDRGLGARPLISLELFRLRSRVMAFLAATAMIISNSSLVLLLSLYLHSVQGLDAWNAGLGVMTSAVGVVSASLVAGILARHVPVRLLSSTGFLLVAGAVTWLAVCPGVDTEVSPANRDSLLTPAPLAPAVQATRLARCGHRARA